MHFLERSLISLGSLDSMAAVRVSSMWVCITSYQDVNMKLLAEGQAASNPPQRQIAVTNKNRLQISFPQRENWDTGSHYLQVFICDSCIPWMTILLALRGDFGIDKA